MRFSLSISSSRLKSLFPRNGGSFATGTLKLFYLFLIFNFVTSRVFAADIEYDIKSFGENITIISLNGLSANSLTVTPSDEGRILTISGYDVNFIGIRQGALPSIVKGIRSLNKGKTFNLILEMNLASTISATPSPDRLQIVAKTIKQKEFKSLIGSKIKEFSNKSPTIMIPSPKEFKGLTSLSSSLKIASFITDILWSFLNGRNFSFEVKESNSNNEKSEADAKKRIAELQNLVDELNSQILELRKERNNS